MKISKGSYVELQYKMYVDKFGGELVEQTKLDEPVQFIVGEGELLPKLEEGLMGLSVGDKFKVKVEVDDAFGSYDEGNILEIQKKELLQNENYTGKVFNEGDIISLFDEDGEEVPVEIIAVEEEVVIVDLNHPFVNEDLYFEGVIIAVEGAKN